MSGNSRMGKKMVKEQSLGLMGENLAHPLAADECSSNDLQLCLCGFHGYDHEGIVDLAHGLVIQFVDVHQLGEHPHLVLA